MPDWIIAEEGARLAGPLDPSRLQEELRAEQESNLLLSEQVADLELALEDRGWRRLSASTGGEFSVNGRRNLRSLCRTMAIANPLIKRGLNLRIAYVWGGGVEISAAATGETKTGDPDGQDVNAVVQDFIDTNLRTLFGSQAQEELERALGTDGEVYLAAFTAPLSGQLRIRSTPADEIVDVISNPEDRDEHWFYIREYVVDVIERGYAGTNRTRRQTVKAAHPALGYRPPARVTTVSGAPVRWDAPILQIPVNRMDGWKHGIPDVYAAIAWARSYKDFLTDWALYVKSLATIAWRATGGTRSQASKAASEVHRANAAATAKTPTSAAGNPRGVGGTVVTGPGQNLEPVQAGGGAHVDAESGKPLAAMAAAGLGPFPVTMILGDPGVTGARATAETLDLPVALEMAMRRMLWQAKLGELIDYAIDQAVLAPRGPLTGTASRDEWGQLVVELGEETDRSIDFDWPPIGGLDPVVIIDAIVNADSTGKLPEVTTARLLLSALGVKNVDEIIEDNTDDQGRWISPTKTAADVAVDRFEQGEDDNPTPAPVAS